MRAFALIFLGVLLLSGCGEELEETQVDKEEAPEKAVIEVKIAMFGGAVEERALINKAYRVANDGSITMWKIGKIFTKEKEEAALARELREAYVKAGIKDASFMVIGPREVDEILDPFILTGEQGESMAELQKRAMGSWKSRRTLYAIIQRHEEARIHGDFKRIRIYRNGQVCSYNMELDKHKGIQIHPRDFIEISRRFD